VSFFLLHRRKEIKEVKRQVMNMVAFCAWWNIVKLENYSGKMAKREKEKKS